MGQTRIQIAEAEINDFFDQLPMRIFKPTEIAAILSDQRANWKLAKSTTVRDFISFLAEVGKLMPYDFPFPYRPEFRYTWGQVPLLEILLTLKQEAYFSHYTAVQLHRLTDRLPATIYLNHEQRPQPKNPYLEQGSIDAAFKRRPRESQNAIEFGGIRICITNGMHTNRLGVVEENLTYDGSAKVQVKVTSIERTLIDIAVRPIYAGGVTEVLKAFSLAKQRANANVIAGMLQKLDYVYPYHQAIGYYLDRAGYPSDAVELFRQRKMEFDFYLTHQMDESRYVKEWRVHVPKHFV